MKIIAAQRAKKYKPDKIKVYRQIKKIISLIHHADSTQRYKKTGEKKKVCGFSKIAVQVLVSEDDNVF